MTKLETLTIELPAVLVEQVRSAVAQGEYRSANEAVSEALGDWSARRDPGFDTERLRAKWQESVEDERPHQTMDEVFDRLEARYGAQVRPNGN